MRHPNGWRRGWAPCTSATWRCGAPPSAFTAIQVRRPCAAQIATSNQNEETIHVREDPPLAWRHQEAALFLRGGGRFHLAARRALYRADRDAQPAAAQGECRSGQ